MSVVDTVKSAIPALPSITLPAVELPDAIEKPVYAVLGAGDLAVEKAKSEVPGLPGQVQARLTKAQEQYKAQAKVLPDLLKGIPALVLSTVQEKVARPLAARQDQAGTFYGTLATRGEKVVTGLQGKSIKPATSASPKKAPAKRTRPIPAS